jgi:hypothetical protein
MPQRAIVAAATLLGALGLAGPAAAQAIGPGSGRTGASVAMGVALIGVVTGGLALTRAGRGSGDGRNAAVVALLLAGMGIVLGALHLATATGAIGTGSGKAGAIVALVLGLIGMVLGRRAHARAVGAGMEVRSDA